MTPREPPPSSSLPNPGSDAALALGCICPVLDNGHGQDDFAPHYDNGKPCFWITIGCNVHGETAGQVVTTVQGSVP